MKFQEVLREIESALDKTLGFNHEEWDRYDVEYELKIVYTVDPENNRIGIKVNVQEEE